MKIFLSALYTMACVPLLSVAIEEHTEGYYSNNEVPSIKKYAINTYESALYSREEAKAMRTCAIITSEKQSRKKMQKVVK